MNSQNAMGYMIISLIIAICIMTFVPDKWEPETDKDGIPVMTTKCFLIKFILPIMIFITGCVLMLISYKK